MADDTMNLVERLRENITDEPGTVRALNTEAAATLESQAKRIAVLREACRAMIAWDEAEKRGPDYGSLTRDTHPQGEEIWRRWWDDQHRLCRHAFDTAHQALAATDDLDGYVLLPRERFTRLLGAWDVWKKSTGQNDRRAQRAWGQIMSEFDALRAMIAAREPQP